MMESDVKYPTTDEMLEEIENQGYEVFRKGTDHLLRYESEELVRELHNRGHYYRDMDDDSLLEEAASRGFFVSHEDKEKDLLWDIYRHAKWMSPEQLRDYLNDLFIKYLDRLL